MEIGRIDNHTMIIGKEQGYLGLPIRVDTVTDPVSGITLPQMTSAWFPLPHELDALARGAPLYLHIMGFAHPPVRLTVGKIPKSND